MNNPLGVILLLFIRLISIGGFEPPRTIVTGFQCQTATWLRTYMEFKNWWGRNWTYDHLFNRQTLCQLSYSPIYFINWLWWIRTTESRKKMIYSHTQLPLCQQSIKFIFKIAENGFEPLISSLWGLRVNLFSIPQYFYLFIRLIHKYKNGWVYFTISLSRTHQTDSSFENYSTAFIYNILLSKEKVNIFL